MSITRRGLLGASAAAAAFVSAPTIMKAATKKVVVIGGGAAGATLTRYLAKDSKGALDITLVEANKNYTTCFFSNWYLGGYRDMQQITHNYDKVAAMGVNVVNNMATGVDGDKKEVTLADGSKLAYDKLVIAPGIDFQYDLVDGYDAGVAENDIPHAYKAGAQTALLKKQMEAMDDGGVFLMMAPPNPYRCPPGPYERASMVANYLQRNKPKSKVIILDPKDKHSKQALFKEAWDNHYPGLVEWMPGAEVGAMKAVRKGEIITEKGNFKGAVLNPIPAQKAGKIAFVAGIADESGWCPIKDATNFESALVPDVHVIGDASINGAMPKSGFSANSQAKAVAMALNAELTGARQFDPRFSNTCWSLVADKDSVKVGANYKAEGNAVVKTDGFISSTGEDTMVREQTFEEAEGWYAGITADMFG